MKPSDDPRGEPVSHQALVDTVLRHYPDTQAVYLFGSYATEYERPDSDVDLAVLLPPQLAKAAGVLTLSACWSTLMSLTGRDVDLINLRTVNTVFQYEIVNTARVLTVRDRFATDEFEMLTWSLYQKLEEERAGIVEQILRTKRIYNV